MSAQHEGGPPAGLVGRLAAFQLPVVRARALPPDGEPLRWDEGSDPLSAAVVALIGMIAISLGISGAAQGVTPVAALAALCLAGIGLAAVLAAIGEFLRLEHIRIHDRRVTVRRRGLAGTREWHASLEDYVGLEPLSRVRRLHVRNQGRPGGSLQGQVTEFVVVLRHRDDAGRDLELFRVQPSLEILRAMHGIQSAGRRGGAAAAQATEHAARRYRDALITLCDRLRLPALVATGTGGREPVDPRTLDLWLQRATLPSSPEGGSGD